MVGNWRFAIRLRTSAFSGNAPSGSSSLPCRRLPTATEFGEALKKLRTRYAPDVRDADVGEVYDALIAEKGVRYVD